MTTKANNTTADDAPADPVSALMGFWSQWMEQSARGTQALLEAAASAGDPDALRKHWTEAMSEASEKFLRTPVFMEMMRQNLKAITDLKRLQDNAVEGTARQLGLPLASDITGLFERLASTERKILARLTAIEERLDAMECAGVEEAEGDEPPKKRAARGRATKSTK